jgi:hypothetical protein
MPAFSVSVHWVPSLLVFPHHSIKVGKKQGTFINPSNEKGGDAFAVPQRKTTGHFFRSRVTNGFCSFFPPKKRHGVTS